MKDKRTTKASSALENRRTGRSDWSRVDALSDEEVEAAAVADPDAPLTDAAFWKDARVVLPGKKVPVTLRLDPDVVRWFKHRGRGYQTRMNAVLRSYVEARRKAGGE